ncbi:hypothetical protein GCM10029964_065800 [Kibdelosporangium lantanae]
MTTTLTAHPAGHDDPAARERAGLLPLSILDHADNPAYDETHERAERGLRHYTNLVADAVGSGPEAAWAEYADAPNAYIALDRRPPQYPDRDTALIWTAERGWMIAVEAGCGEDLMIIASLGHDPLPAPHTVAAFVRAVLAGRPTGPPTPIRTPVTTELIHQLARWADAEPIATPGELHDRHERRRPRSGFSEPESSTSTALAISAGQRRTR